MTQDADGEDVLLQLRQDMMEFILQELTKRAAGGKLPVLGEPLAGLLREEVNKAVSDAMRDAQRADASRIADLVAERLGDSTPPAPADEGRTRKAENAAKDKDADSQKPSARGLRARLWGLPLSTILSVFLGIVLVIVAWMYVGETRNLAGVRSAAAEAETLSREALAGVCRQTSRIRDQVRILNDTREYTATCGAGRPGAGANPICVAVTTIRGLSNLQQCNAAAAR